MPGKEYRGLISNIVQCLSASSSSAPAAPEESLQKALLWITQFLEFSWTALPVLVLELGVAAAPALIPPAVTQGEHDAQPAQKKTYLERRLERTWSRRAKRWGICTIDTISPAQPQTWLASQTIQSREWDQVCDTVQALTALRTAPRPEPLPVIPFSCNPTHGDGYGHLGSAQDTWEGASLSVSLKVWTNVPELKKKHQELPFQTSTVGCSFALEMTSNPWHWPSPVQPSVSWGWLSPVTHNQWVTPCLDQLSLKQRRQQRVPGVYRGTTPQKDRSQTYKGV